MLDISVADEAARTHDDLLGQPADLCHARVEIARRVVLRWRTGKRRQVIGQRETLGFPERFAAERSFALQLGRCQRRQLQRGPECKTGAAEQQRAFDQGRHHEDAGHGDALLALQGLRHLGRAEPAIAFPEDVFGRVAASVPGRVERDDFGHCLRIGTHAVKDFVAFRLRRAAPSGSYRIDHHQIGEGEPSLWVVL